MAMSGLAVPTSASKPRYSRLTMVLDQGMPMRQTEDWLSICAPYVDVVKFGWGTSALMSQSAVAAKIGLLRDHNVIASPGGTLTELYFLQGRIDQMIEDYRTAGFTSVEVSDGTVQMQDQQRATLVTRLVNEGFTVSTEVGSKDPARDRRLTPEERARLVLMDLDGGASYVTIEARESGTLGFFGADQEVLNSELEIFVGLVDPARVMFEAPIKAQQTELILRLGNDVNLGNIPPGEVLSVESLRQGLRSDTLLAMHGEPVNVRLGQGPSDALEASRRGDVIIVVDALRASSTIAAALTAGCSSVRVVATVEDCRGDLTAGERGGIKIPDLDFDNSPLGILSSDVAGRSLTLTTTNGAECILAACSEPKATVLVGALVNASAVGREAWQLAREKKRSVAVIMAGRNQVLAEEDLLSASEIILAMGNVRLYPGSELMPPTDPDALFHESASGRNLVERGSEDDVSFCARKDALNVVPRVVDGLIVTSGPA